jgi:hypothetical protein
MQIFKMIAAICNDDTFKKCFVNDNLDINIFMLFFCRAFKFSQYDWVKLWLS